MSELKEESVLFTELLCTDNLMTLPTYSSLRCFAEEVDKLIPELKLSILRLVCRGCRARHVKQLRASEHGPDLHSTFSLKHCESAQECTALFGQMDKINKNVADTIACVAYYRRNYVVLNWIMDHENVDLPHDGIHEKALALHGQLDLLQRISVRYRNVVCGSYLTETLPAVLRGSGDAQSQVAYLLCIVDKIEKSAQHGNDLRRHVKIVWDNAFKHASIDVLERIVNRQKESDNRLEYWFSRLFNVSTRVIMRSTETEKWAYWMGLSPFYPPDIIAPHLLRCGDIHRLEEIRNKNPHEAYDMEGIAYTISTAIHDNQTESALYMINMGVEIRGFDITAAVMRGNTRVLEQIILRDRHMERCEYDSMYHTIHRTISIFATRDREDEYIKMLDMMICSEMPIPVNVLMNLAYRGECDRLIMKMVELGVIRKWQIRMLVNKTAQENKRQDVSRHFKERLDKWLDFVHTPPTKEKEDECTQQ